MAGGPEMGEMVVRNTLVLSGLNEDSTTPDYVCCIERLHFITSLERGRRADGKPAAPAPVGPIQGPSAARLQTVGTLRAGISPARATSVGRARKPRHTVSPVTRKEG